MDIAYKKREFHIFLYICNIIIKGFKKFKMIISVAKTLPYFILMLLLSCSNAKHNKQSESIRNLIAEIFQAENVTIERGREVGSKGANRYLEISVSNSTILEKDKTIDPADAASIIAFNAYHFIKEDPEEKGSSINVGLNYNDKNYKYEFDYALMERAYDNTILADSLFACMRNGKYDKAYSLFGDEFKINFSEEQFKEIFIRADSVLGKVTSHKMNGIELEDLNLNNKAIKTIRIDFFAIRDKYTKIQLFFDVQNKGMKILWINM